MPYNHQHFDARQSMTNKQFEIFHYRDQHLENVNVHHHDFYEIYFFLGGNVRFRIEGRAYCLEPGDLLLINPQELHQPEISPDSPYERIVLWVDRNYLNSLSSDNVDLAGCFDTGRPNHVNLLRTSKAHRTGLHQLLERMSREFRSENFGSNLYAQGLLLQLLVELNRLSNANSLTLSKQQKPDLIAQVLGYISTHYHESITLESLAAEFFVSKYHLSHEFSRQVGTSVYRYIIFRRLMQAKELMVAGQAPGEVYQKCGFGDYANFYRAFKEEYGISPREFAAGITK